MKEQQLLRDSGTEPTSEIIAEGLGEANSAYIQFIEELFLVGCDKSDINKICKQSIII